MLSEISWGQFREWQTYAELEILPNDRLDWNFAHVVQAVMRDGKELQEFRLSFGDMPNVRAREQTIPFMEHQIDAWIFGSNAVLLAKEKRGS